MPLELSLPPHALNPIPCLLYARTQVGEGVDRSSLDLDFNRLVFEARAKFHQKQFEEALHLFRQCQAVAEKISVGREAHTEFGANAHNIASCLHCLGHFEEARAHYEKALSSFQRRPPSRLWIAIYGDVDRRRCDFVRERIVDLDFGRKPDLDKYLDGLGHKRDVTPDLADHTSSARFHAYSNPIDPFGHARADPMHQFGGVGFGGAPLRGGIGA